MAAKLNKTVFTIHQWLGLYTGLILLILSITGAAIVFADELDSSINGTVMKVTPGDNRVPLDVIVADLKNRYPEAQIKKMQLQFEFPSHAVYAEMEKDANNKKQVFYNQYTGALLGERNKEKSFVHILVALHTRLLAGKPGKLIVGLMGIGLFITTLTGIYFYRKSLFSVFRIGIRWDKNVKTISSDTHKLLGVSALLFNLLFGFTGFYMHRHEFFGKKEKDGMMAALPSKKFQVQDITISLDELVGSHQHLAGFVPAVIDFPKPKQAYYKLKGNTAESSRLTGGKHDTEILLAYADLSPLQIITPQNTSTAKKFNTLMSELHYGRFGGLAIKILYTLMGLVTALLSITGFIIWYKKKYKKAALARQPVLNSPPVILQPVTS